MSDRISQLKTMLDAEPNDTFCMYGLAMEYAKQGDLDQSIAWFDKIIAIDPNHCYAYFHKAKVQEEAGDVAAACDTLRIGLEQAKAIGDAKAANEIAAYLDELT